MKKYALVLMLLAIFFIFSSPQCFAEEGSNLPEVEIEIPEGLEEYIPTEIYSKNPDEIMNTITFENALKTALSVLKSVLPEAMELFLGILGLIIISAVISALRESIGSGAVRQILEYVSVLCIAAAAFSSVSALFAEFEAFISQIKTFMAAVVPVVSALMLSLTIRLYRKYHTLDIDRITLLMKGEDN